MMKDWGDITTERDRWIDEVEWLELPKNKYVSIRLVGGVYPTARHWVETKTGKFYSELCHNFNSDLEKFEDRGCPVCKLEKFKAQRIFYANCIDRREQARKEENPIRGFCLSNTLAREIKSKAALNGGKTVSHTVFGVELDIKYMPDVEGANKYSVNAGERTPLTEEEKAYELYAFDTLIKLTDTEEIIRSLKANGHLHGDTDEGTSQNLVDRSLLQDEELPRTNPRTNPQKTGQTRPKNGNLKAQVTSTSALKERLASLDILPEKSSRVEENSPSSESLPNHSQEESSSDASVINLDTPLDLPLADQELNAHGQAKIGDWTDECYGDYLGERKCFECKRASMCMNVSFAA